MIRLLIYIYVGFLFLKKLFTVLIHYKEYYSEKRIKLNLVKANTNSKRDTGLMNRKKKLNNNEGMLFIYKTPQYISMWMKNTFIPLDVLFLDNDYKVVEYKENMTPLKLNKHASKIKCKYAIEINGGGTKKNNIKIGTRIIPKIINKFN
jgi:uncharacterized membrane protein (UPF0127 family)